MNARSQEAISLTAADHLVGNLWFNLEALPFIASRLEPDTMRHVAPGSAAAVYSEMCRLFRTPSEQLSAGALEANLGAQGFNFDWLAQVQSRIEPEGVSTLESYARQIANAAELRRIQEACHGASQSAREPDANAATVAGDLMKALTPDDSRVNDVEHVSLATARLRERNSQIRTGKYDWGASTGFRALDRVFRMRDGDLITLGGRPSQGKTSLARQIALNRAMAIAESGEQGQVVFFSADDTTDKVTDGLACGLAQVDSTLMETNQLSAEEWERLDWAMQRIEALPLYIDDTPAPTVEGMYYRCAMLNAQNPVQLAVMDYLELVKHPDGGRDRLERIGDAARGIKGIGKQLGFPFMLLSQLRKVVDERPDKWPTPADMMYAGEAESDVMLLAMRPEHYLSRGESCDHQPGDEEGVALINVAKNKRGRIGKVRLAFRKEWSWFFDVMRVPLDSEAEGE